MDIAHASRTDLWYTPGHILDMARTVLGGAIDLDPASDEFGNERVGAAEYYSKELDGLSRPWTGTVYVNPPGGKRRNRSMTSLFWQKLMSQRSFITHAVFMCFSAEAATTTQGHGCPSVLDFPICVPARRIQFDGPDGKAGKAPSHSNIVVYIPGSKDHTELFLSVFSLLGACKR